MTSNAPSKSSAHQGMFLWAGIVGLSFPAVSLISEGLPPLLLTAIRFLIAAIAIAPLVMSKPDFRPGSAGLALYSFMGIALAGFFGTMFWAAPRMTALSMATLYVGTPMMAYLLGRAVGVEERAGSLLVILTAGAMGALGLTWAGADGRLVQLQFGAGEAAYLLGCIASASYPVLSKLGLSKQWLSPSAEVRTFWSLVIGSAWVGLFGADRRKPRRLARHDPARFIDRNLPRAILERDDVLAGAAGSAGTLTGCSDRI